MKNLEKIIVVDVETSGLDPARHAVVEFGFAALMDERTFSMRCRLPFGAEWSQEALNVNGLTLEQITDLSMPLPFEGLMAFYDAFGWEEFLFAGQNIGSFDIPFLRATMKAGTALGAPKWPKMRQRCLDMHSVAIGYLPPLTALKESESPICEAPSALYAADVMQMDANSIYRLLDMQQEPTPHRALTGARMEREALRIMLGLEGK